MARNPTVTSWQRNWERQSGTKTIALEKAAIRQVVPGGPTLVCQYNPESVIESGDVGGWDELERPKQKPVTDWRRQPLRLLTFSILFDGYPDKSMEPQIAMLRNFGRPREEERPPPVLAFDYGPVGRNVRWVIDSLEPGPELRRSDLQVVQQDFAVVFKEFVSADVALTAVERHKKRSQPDSDGRNESTGGRNQGTPRLYTVKKGDTLASIAARLLGKASRWTEIAKLNNLRDPNYIKVGQKLKIPRA